MKSDDKTQNNTPIKNTITPQSAMDDYFSGMFNCSDQDSLQELSDRQDTTNDDLAKQGTLIKKSVAKSYPKPKLKPKKKKKPFRLISF